MSGRKNVVVSLLNTCIQEKQIIRVPKYPKTAKEDSLISEAIVVKVN